jgi:formylglycine-generating enzyme required for sulfatase activity
LVGQTISHYRVLEKLGGGGMGVVYKATDLRLNRFVALKFLSPHLTRDADAKERFVHEAQAASALDHPNICTIHEIDETADGELFLTLAYYEGETLKHRIERGPLAIDEAMDIVTQVAQALARAHESGIIHRDIKPANLMLPKDGPVKIVDFGLAKLVGHSDLTKTGTTVGTVAYMSPEQIRGAEAGPAADVWAVGVVLYQMLAGTRPFDGKDDLAVISSIIDDAPRPIGELRPETPEAVRRIVARALNKQLSARYGSASALLADLVSLQAERRSEESGSRPVLQTLKRPIVFVPALVILALAAVPAVTAYRRAARVRWAHEEAIPKIRQLIADDKLVAAFDLAKEVERAVPNDGALIDLRPQFALPGSIATAPAGADVYVQPYASQDDRFEYLGRTPIDRVLLPRATLRFKFEKSGFDTQFLAAINPSTVLQNSASRLSQPITIALPRAGTAADMVQVPGGSFPVALSGFTTDDLIALEPFAIDRYEVSNAAFKAFVDGGGYTTNQYWQGLSFVDHGLTLTLSEATSRFHDLADRPGPATWEAGGFPSGQDEFPVGGVSWYEAVAYCRSVGKTLPTLFHWTRAALGADETFAPLAPSIIPLSNLGGKGPVRRGTSRGMGPYGTYDMGGNVREWTWNESQGTRRWILGGAWNDPEWMLIQRNSQEPLDRSVTSGFRCAQYDPVQLPARLNDRVQVTTRDARAIKAVSDEVYEVFKRQYAYTAAPLNARIDATDDASPDWIRERITFDAADERSRVPVMLFRPKRVKPPYQLAVVFPGLSAFLGRASSSNLQPGSLLDVVVRSGRALPWPIYKGSFERWDSFLDQHGPDSQRATRTRMIEWREELGRALDMVDERKTSTWSEWPTLA